MRHWLFSHPYIIVWMVPATVMWLLLFKERKTQYLISIEEQIAFYLLLSVLSIGWPITLIIIAIDTIYWYDVWHYIIRRLKSDKYDVL